MPLGGWGLFKILSGFVKEFSIPRKAMYNQPKFEPCLVGAVTLFKH